MTTAMRSRGAALAVLAALSLAGCGSAAAPSEPEGVDGLVIPTPSPQPADFVTTVDNPWFPLVPGSRWEYDDNPASPARTLVVEAAAGPVILGIATTTRVSTEPGTEPVRDHFAQDRAGNVWWLGREGEWMAGTDGARAGLAMPASPRRGDGFVMADLPGVDPVGSVVELDVPAVVPQGIHDDTVVLDVTLDGATSREVYAEGVGLVEKDSTGLVAYDEPRRD